MPEISIILPGSIRIKKNSKRVFSMGKHKVVLPSTAYIAWEKEAREYAWDLLVREPRSLFHCSIPGNQLPSFPVREDVSVCATCYIKGPLPDLSGALESVGDCLQGIIWIDDKQIFSWDGSRVVHELKNPRTVVRVKW